MMRAMKAFVGANVVLKGTSIGSVSDMYGFYRIEVPDKGVSLYSR
jgi:hypothetical protein